MTGHDLKASFATPFSSSVTAVRSIKGYLGCFRVSVSSQALERSPSRCGARMTAYCGGHR